MMMFDVCLAVLYYMHKMIYASPNCVEFTSVLFQSWQKATNSSSVMGTRLGFRITGAIDSKSSTTNCMRPVYCARTQLSVQARSEERRVGKECRDLEQR